MLITKTNPVGIDQRIQKLQTLLHSRLTELWGIDVNDATANKSVEFYGRCYRNKKNNGYIAEVYDGNKEYKEVYWNDSLKAISFFGISSKEDYDVGHAADVHLVFFVDLKALKQEIAHRADEEVRMDVKKLFGKSLLGFSYISMEIGLENVLREYQGSYRDERLKAVDMHPIHCFRVNLRLMYDINKNC